MKEIEEWSEAEYFKDFSCKCGECRHTCCAGWKIAVSEKEYFRLIGLDCSEELHERLESAFYSPEYPSTERYKMIEPNWLGQCRMLAPDGWCSLQRECGEEVLPEVCRAYPRSMKVINGRAYACCSGSCERTVELLQKADSFRLVPGTGGEHAEFCETVNSDYEEKLSKTLELLRDRSISLENRLIKVCKYFGYENTEEGTAAPVTEEELLEILVKLDEESATLREYSTEIFERYGRELNRNAKDFLEDEQKFIREHRDWERWAENLLCNNLIYSGFPYADSRISAKSACKGLCLQYVILKLVCTAYMSDHASDEDLTDAIAAVYHLVEHTAFYYNAEILVKEPIALMNMIPEKPLEIGGEVKLMGDEYEGFYSCGMTMLGSPTMRRFNVLEQTAERQVMKSEDGLTLTVSHIPNEKTGATVIQTEFANNSEKPVTLELLTSFYIKSIKADKIHRLLSFWSAEGRHRTDTVKELNMEMSWGHFAYRVEKFGNVGSMPVRKYFPFLALEDSETGTFTAVQLYTPSSWQIEIICRQEEKLNIAGGIADRDFGQWTKTLQPGESIMAPKAVVAVGRSLEEVCDMLVKSQTPDISPVDDRMGITFNEYCATWGNPTLENMKRVADRIAGKGIQYLVMDSGWYGGDEGYWWDYIGEWEVNRNKFPNGLKEAADYIRSRGMIPGIWFELECLAPRSKMFHSKEHLVMKDGVPLTIGGRRFLDMEDPWVQDYLKEKVIGLLKEAGYGYIKVDYNDTMGIGCDGPDGLGENLRRKVLGTQAFYKKMREEIPELVIENCSAGGHRLEPSMMELSSQASFSDAHETTAIPLIAANLHRVIRPEQSQIWAVMRKDDSDARIFYSMCATLLGRMGLSGDIYDLSEHQWQLIDEGMDFYRRAADIIRHGKTTVICATPDSYNAPCGGQLVVREYDGIALVVYHRFEDSVDFEEFIRQQGVELHFSDVLKEYGSAVEDFSAIARLVKL